MIRFAAHPRALLRSFSPLVAAPRPSCSSRAGSSLSGGGRGGRNTASSTPLLLRSAIAAAPFFLRWQSSLVSKTAALRGIGHLCASTTAANAATFRSLGSLSSGLTRFPRMIIPTGSTTCDDQSGTASTTSTAKTGASLWERRSFTTKSGGRKGMKKDEAKGTRESQASPPAPSAPAAPTQHEEWVAFQRTISVQGFETGQTTQVAPKSKRGGKLVRRRQQKLRERDLDDPNDPRRFTDLAGGEFPPLRYSPEETERLLAQAYANLPERAGKRGTRNLKRQGRRWFLVRKVRKLYKYHMSNFQDRKMAKRSEKIRLVKEVLQEAPDIRFSDRQYQAQVFANWSSRMDQRQRRVGMVAEGGSEAGSA